LIFLEQLLDVIVPISYFFSYWPYTASRCYYKILIQTLYSCFARLALNLCLALTPAALASIAELKRETGNIV